MTIVILSLGGLGKIEIKDQLGPAEAETGAELGKIKSNEEFKSESKCHLIIYLFILELSATIKRFSKITQCCREGITSLVWQVPNQTRDMFHIPFEIFFSEVFRAQRRFLRNDLG